MKSHFQKVTLALAAVIACMGTPVLLRSQPAPAAATAPARALAPDLVDQAKASIAEFQPRIEKLRQSDNPLQATLVPTLEYTLGCLKNYLDPSAWEARWMEPAFADVPGGEIAFRSAMTKQALSEIQNLLTELEAGRNPYVKYPGTLVLAYRSKLDGRLLGFRMSIPRNFKPGEKRYPLVINNASSGGASGGQMRALRGIRAHSQHDESLIGTISDRGECHYGNDVHDQEFAEALVEIPKIVALSIDPDRMYKQGGSKDGHSGVYLATHYPHLLSAVRASASHNLPDGGADRKPAPIFQPGRLINNSFVMAENMYSLPVALIAGYDGDHPNTTVMGCLLEKIAAPNKMVRAEPEAGHGEAPWSTEEVARWIPTHVRNPYPKRIYVNTSNLRHHKFYWVEVDELRQANRFARMRVDSLENNRIEVAAHNVARFSLVTLDKLVDAAKPVSVEIDDQRLENLLPKNGVLSFVFNDGKWAAADRDTQSVIKKNGLSGPMMDGWLRPCIHVIGTLGGEQETARLRQMMATEIRAFHWEGASGFRSIDHPVKTDKEVTPQDVRDKNLILWGNDRTNAIIQQINPRLPVRLDGNAVILPHADRRYAYADVGLAMIYPNPLNPQRYAMIFSGNTWMCLENNWMGGWRADNLKTHEVKAIDLAKLGTSVGGYPMLPDYMIFRQNRRGYQPRFTSSAWENPDISILEGGFFNSHWQPDDSDPFFYRNLAKQKDAPLVVPAIVQPRTAGDRPAAATNESAKPLVMTKTPGVLTLGTAQEQDGLIYQFAAAHHGRYFYREFGSVFTTNKILILEVRVTNKSKPAGYEFPLLKTTDMPELMVGERAVKPFAVTAAQAFPSMAVGDSARIVLWYNVDPAKTDILTVKGVGLGKALAITTTGADLTRSDHNPDNLREGATW